MKAVILGPHPRNGSMSTSSYFDFYASRLPKWLPATRLSSAKPGDGRTADAEGVRTRWENFVAWPMRLTTVDADLIHVVDQGLAWYFRFTRAGRRLITVHDLIAHMAVSQLLDVRAAPRRRYPLIAECIRQIRRADHIVSVSECTADHLVALLEIPAKKITVVPNVIEHDLGPLSASQRVLARRRWFGDAECVIIHVGKATSYKNRIGALRAFEVLLRKVPQARMFLVHGAPTSEEGAFIDESGIRSKVQFLPPVTREELREFYGAADVLVFPSLYEGFGWPPLEAMACGCPVVCTTRGSLGEVVADAAMTVSDPHDHAGVAEALHAVLVDESTVRDLKIRGFKRVKDFAPEVMLARMADVYRSTGA